MSATDPAAGVGTGWVRSGWQPSPRIMDRVEQVALVALFALLVWRMVPGSLAAVPLFTWLLLVSEATVVAFVLIRRPTDHISVRPWEWLVAFGGTFAPLLVMPTDAPWMPALGVALMTMGWVVHLGAKLTLRRSFGIVAADRGLKTDGIYAVVRHPMYMGYLITHAGYLIAVPSVWNATFYGVAWACMICRMQAEEGVLSANPAYAAYRAKVRYRMIPGVW